MVRTQINSELLLASLNVATGDILYTFVWTYPRIILPEVNTHRMLSRNTSSSRAIPSKKQRRKVWDDPFVPTSLGVNKKGMQAGEELTGLKRRLAEGLWKAARIPALGAAWAMEKLGVHKQITNRLIEPWTWTTQLVSATDLDNLFLLRDHHMAEPHFQEVARQAHTQALNAKKMLTLMRAQGWEAMRGSDKSLPYLQLRYPGQWHMPFITLQDALTIGDTETAKKVSAARCARVSYNLPENGERSTLERDLELFERLAGSNPKHLSPLEHQAVALFESVYHGNFKGFSQYRKEIIGESGAGTSIDRL